MGEQFGESNVLFAGSGKFRPDFSDRSLECQAGFVEGMAAYERKDFITALQEFKPLAEQVVGQMRWASALLPIAPAS